MKHFLYVIVVSAFYNISPKFSTKPFFTSLNANKKYGDSKFEPIERLPAINRFKTWKTILDAAEYYYPQSTRDAVTCGKNYVITPELLIKNKNDTIKVLEWQHSVPARKKDLFKDVFYTEDKRPMKKLPSHVILGIENNYTKTYNIHGIVENPENILYEFSIHFMLHKLRSKYKKIQYKLDISSLEKWCYGIYYFSLKHSYDE